SVRRSVPESASGRSGDMGPPSSAKNDRDEFGAGLVDAVELVRMSGDSGVDSGVLMLEWRSPGEEEIDLLGSAAGSCKEVGSGRFPT
ncbi:hypothetical protein BHE74_00057892, partial [Ensete ventricosum]